MTDIHGEYDLAIVGGGIAGLYCGLNTPPGLRIALFEATDRIGGKVETASIEGFQTEWGSMRFDPNRQHMMGKLMAELDLETEPFPEYSSPPTGERRLAYGLQPEERGLNALELFAQGIGKILHKSVAELMAASEEELEHFRREGMHRGSPLWEHGLWRAMADVLSYDAVTYIMTEGSFFHGIHENPGVAGTMITWVKMLQMSPTLKGVKGGMEGITGRMLERVRNKGVDVYTEHSLEALVPEGNGRITLVFGNARFSARQVILALPATPLKTIKGIPDEIRRLLDSVIEYPLLKCFFVVDEPWWDEDIPNRGVATFPARELHYYRQGRLGNIMVYADRPSLNFWAGQTDLGKHDRAEIGRNERLPILFAERMKISPDRIVSYGIRDWMRKPYGAGVHLWRVGVEPWKVSERLEAFSLSGDSHHNVHICGEAFSDYQGFMEGAVRSAHRALEKALS